MSKRVFVVGVWVCGVLGSGGCSWGIGSRDLTGLRCEQNADCGLGFVCAGPADAKVCSVARSVVDTGSQQPGDRDGGSASADAGGAGGPQDGGSPGADAGPSGGAPDAGAADAGTSGKLPDAGTADVDAGGTRGAADAGPTGADAGASSGVQDAGTAAAGDAGSAPVDAGGAVVDAGPADAGPGDAGERVSPSCGDAVSFDGYSYRTVQIGDQCWFAENLRSTHYANGDDIPGSLTNNQWSSASTGARSSYDWPEFGRLYNWYAVADGRGLCPDGWHVPTEREWRELIDFVGGIGGAGRAMKAAPTDNPSWDGENTVGFSALPGGWRYGPQGYFGHQGSRGIYWSSTPSTVDPDSSVSVHLSSANNDLDIYNSSNSSKKRSGFSVRCLLGE